MKVKITSFKIEQYADLFNPAIKQKAGSKFNKQWTVPHTILNEISYTIKVNNQTAINVCVN